MRIFYSEEESFEREFAELLGRGKMDIESVEGSVRTILDEIRHD